MKGKTQRGKNVDIVDKAHPLKYFLLNYELGGDDKIKKYCIKSSFSCYTLTDKKMMGKIFIHISFFLFHHVTAICRAPSSLATIVY